MRITGKITLNITNTVLGIALLLVLVTNYFSQAKMGFENERIIVGDQEITPDHLDGGLHMGNRLHLKAENGVSGSVCWHIGTVPIVDPLAYRLWVDPNGGLQYLLPNGNPDIKVNHQIIKTDELGNTVIPGTLTVNGDQQGATNLVFDDYDDITLLEKWRKGGKLPFEKGDMLNRDRLLRDAIIQLNSRISKLERG